MPKALVRSGGLLLLALFVLQTGRVAHAATVTNGGFESGDFTGWTAITTCNSLAVTPGAAPAIPAFGNWYVYSGTFSPLTHLPISAPPQGNFAATSDEIGPSTHVLYQDLTLDPGATPTLSFTLYYSNLAGALATLAGPAFTSPAGLAAPARPPGGALFASPPTLNCNTFPMPNQQYRVDLVRPSAAIDSVAPADVLQNLYQTQPGDPSVKPPTLLTFDLSAYAGQTVRLRFADVETVNPLLASVDNVQLVSTPIQQPQMLPTGPLGSVQTAGCGGVTVSSTATPVAGTILSTAGVIPAGEGPGTALYLTAVPCAGSKFTGWSGGPCDGTATNPCQLTIITGTLPGITANFSP